MGNQDGSHGPFEHQPLWLLPPPTPVPVHAHAQDTSFPILAISIVGMLTTALLLLSYYIFVTKCCISWHRPDVILRRLSRSRRNRFIDDRLRSFYSTTIDREGLDESVIQAIPTLRFRHAELSFHDCAVCLNEFKEQEKIRMLPNCYHVFHIDCIDTWLQSHSNCPICRADITTTTTAAAIRAVPTAQRPNSFISGESVVIEVCDDDGSSEQETESATTEKMKKKNKKNLHKVASVGDECIDLREKDKEFNVQPMRRSFSMDSMGDRQLYMAVQEILHQNPHFRGVKTGSSEEGSSSSSSSSSGRVRRSFFSFGRGI